MGWLWSSSSEGDVSKTGSPPSESDTSKRPDWALTGEQRQRIFGKSGPLSGTDQFRSSQADTDLEAFLNSFATSESRPPEAIPQQTAEPPTTTQPKERTNHDRVLPDGSINISPAALYPRTMSCRQAFDQAFYCQSLGGKFNDIYRFGHLQSCSEQWGAFWFCMRTKSYSQKDKEEQIRDYYAAREERKRKEFGSSENVWQIREKAVQKAFWKDPDAVDEGGDIQLKE